MTKPAMKMMRVDSAAWDAARAVQEILQSRRDEMLEDFRDSPEVYRFKRKVSLSEAVLVACREFASQHLQDEESKS